MKKKRTLPPNNEDASPSSWNGLNLRKILTLSWRKVRGWGSRGGGLKRPEAPALPLSAGIITSYISKR